MAAKAAMQPAHVHAPVRIFFESLIPAAWCQSEYTPEMLVLTPPSHWAGSGRAPIRLAKQTRRGISGGTALFPRDQSRRMPIPMDAALSPRRSPCGGSPVAGQDIEMAWFFMFCG
jgi:hypothetical protein